MRGRKNSNGKRCLIKKVGTQRKQLRRGPLRRFGEGREFEAVGIRRGRKESLDHESFRDPKGIKTLLF